MKESFNFDNGEVRNNMRQHLELVAVMGAGRSFLPIYTIFAISAVVIIHPNVSRLITVAWVSAYFIYTVIRTIATSLYHDDSDRENISRIKDWRRFVFFSALTHGVILGSLAVIALPVLTPARQLVLTAFVLIVTTGAVLYVSSFLPALIVLISAALLPYIVVWYFQGNSFEVPVAFFLLVAWIINLLMSLIHHKAGSRLFDLIVDNDLLVRNLEEKNRELEIADRARLHLLTVTSHDLRQPVHALGLILAHASEYDDVQSIGKHFDKLKEISNLISEMLLELMDLSMLEHDENGKRIEEVCLTAILKQLKTSQEPIARRKGLIFDIFADEEIWVLADAGLLRRMILNLISNAIKYTITGAVTVECDIQGGRVLISIRDTGVGIPEDKLGEIFRPYVRLHPNIAEKESLGLGLAIVHRAAVVQGFEIQVSSTIGVGSVFKLYVPLGVKNGEHEIQHQAMTSGLSAIPLENVLMIVVDDDFFAREALVMLLEYWGYSTLSASTVGDLKEKINFVLKPSLIISDNNLSVFEFGYDVIQTVRSHFNDLCIPGIVVSGDPDISINGLSCVEVARKPIKPDFLRELVIRLTSEPLIAQTSKPSNS